jgi:hypothetical protein
LNDLQKIFPRLLEHFFRLIKLFPAHLDVTTSLSVPGLSSEEARVYVVAHILEYVDAWVQDNWIQHIVIQEIVIQGTVNLAVASAPTLTIGVAELVPASAGHVVAAARDLVHHLLTPLAGLPTLLVGLPQCLLHRLVCLVWTSPRVGHGSTLCARRGVAE